MIAKVLILFVAFSVTYAQKTPVYVYYESMCPDSQAFVNKQLYPAYKTMKDHIDIHFIPFGKSDARTQGSDVIFNCHHGPAECYGNKIHACAISHLQVDSFQNEHTRESLTVDFVDCLMTYLNFKDDPYTVHARKCAEKVQVKKYESIELCANGTEGSQLLQDMGEKTDKLEKPLKSVPTITIRESYDPAVQRQALTDFQGAVCTNLPKPMPAICRAYSGASSITSGIFTTIVAIFAAFRFF